MHAYRASVNLRTRTRSRFALPRMVVAALLLLPSTALAAEIPKAPPRTPLKNPQGVGVQVQLKGWGFENTAGFRADMTGSAGSVGRVHASLEEDASLSVVLGIQDGKLRVRSKARYTFVASDGTFFGDSPSVLAIPIILTAAGPAPDPNRFIDAEVTIDVLGGTGRYRNAGGTIALRGILAEIPPEAGRRRFAVELSGGGDLIVERDSVG